MPIKAEKTFSLKDQLFNKETVTELSNNLSQAHPTFNQKSFNQKVLAKFPELELKQRIDHIVDVLETQMPSDVEAALKILTKALPEPLDATKTDDDFGKFIWVVPSEYVAKHGCTDDHVDLSLNFLRESTKRFSSEFAIRPFLKNYPEQTLEFVHQCARDKNYHVRRLASEGIRPFLPWGARVVLPASTIMDVLSVLHEDQTRFVTRSVANNLNDVSKLDAELVLNTLEGWHKNSTQQPAELQWITKHALRTLLKSDHAGALSLMGYANPPRFTVNAIKTTDAVQVGSDFNWQCQLKSKSDQRLKVTLKLHFLKANGTHSVKVFAVKDGLFAKDDVLQINKKQSFKPATTRTLYAGEHFAELCVNGITTERRSFQVFE